MQCRERQRVCADLQMAAVVLVEPVLLELAGETEVDHAVDTTGVDSPGHQGPRRKTRCHEKHEHPDAQRRTIAHRLGRRQGIRESRVRSGRQAAFQRGS